MKGASGGWRRFHSEWRFAVVVGMGVAAALAGSAGAASYSVVNLGSLGGGTTYGWGINNLGQVVGWSASADGYAHAMVYAGGGMTDLGTLGTANCASYGYGINDNGQVVGVSQLAYGSMTEHAFLSTGGQMTDLGTLGGTTSFANAINNLGQVVGGSDTSTGTRHGFLYSGGVMSDIGAFIPYAINNQGQIVGSDGNNAVLYYNGVLTGLGSLGGQGGIANRINATGQIAGASPTGTGQGGAFLLSGGQMLSLGSPSASLPFSIAFGLNDYGAVVGEAYNNDTGIYHAFVYQNGQMLDLNQLIPNIPGLTLTDAELINDSGLIVANGNFGGQNEGFLLTPVPEAGCGALLALGLGMLMARGVFRRLESRRPTPCPAGQPPGSYQPRARPWERRRF